MPLLTHRCLKGMASKDTSSRGQSFSQISLLDSQPGQWKEQRQSSALLKENLPLLHSRAPYCNLYFGLSQWPRNQIRRINLSGQQKSESFLEVIKREHNSFSTFQLWTWESHLLLNATMMLPLCLLWSALESFRSFVTCLNTDILLYTMRILPT